MQSPFKLLTAGTAVPKGMLVELCRRDGSMPENVTVIEEIEADGTWIVPETVNRHFYRGATRAEVDRYLRAEYGVGCVAAAVRSAARATS